MKTMTCRQLGGACDTTFQASSFEKIAEQSKQHGIAMFKSNDADHLKAMQEIQKLMQKPEAMQEWFEGKRKEFEDLPEDE